MDNRKKTVSAGFCIMLSMMLLITPFPWLIAMITAAIFHEFCHWIAIRSFTATPSGLHLFSYSARITLPELSAGKELLCALAGPLGGLALFLLARWFPRLALCAMAQSVYNLLPIYPLDGGRALSCLLQMITSPPRAAKILSTVGFLCKLFILAVGLMGWIYYHLGPLSLFLAILLIIRVK
jgi:stage IV sporulation protein FB